MAYIFEDYTFYDYLKWLMNYMKLDKRVLYGKECGTLCPHSFVESATFSHSDKIIYKLGSVAYDKPFSNTHQCKDYNMQKTLMWEDLYDSKKNSLLLVWKKSIAG